MAERLPDAALDTLFRTARTANGWTGEPVPPETLVALYDLVKWGPTSANMQPLRVKFLVTTAAKERLRPHLSPGNVEKTMAAPVVAVLGQDLAFYEHLPRLFPHNPSARSWFEGKPELIRESALRNASLQGGYFILAARALGLDAGPMSGFDSEGVDREFWQGTSVKTNFLCNLGHADPSKTFPRSPRFDFTEVCELL
ncbi:malonic semialdehyde reductase [Elioraea tepida]|uniref:Putative NADH dehydrogenase/NAD(P)H nitroreductase KO353_15335 n=1 Tax=Elioraea tepida TaxID=2843330 RepID=A0A975U1M1_9PROT|nr:malonic semialdehyde reductase [Elioraea tepida]QXM24585.1 malonic semialdehyde reductase [Elioraea tepida]